MGVIYGQLASEFSGSEYGYGSGYGSGDGYGSKEYLQAICDGAAGSRAEQLKADGAMLAFWRSDKNGKPCNNGTGPSRSVGMVEEEKGPLIPCRKGALHATMQPEKWKGERLWVVALYPPVEKVDDDKFASLKREIIAEIVPNFF